MLTSPASVPDRAALPALCRGLVVVEHASGLVIEGGPYRMLLTGDAARLLPRLLPLLDGRHGFGAVCAELSIEPGLLRQALELLDSWGVLEPPGTPVREQAVPGRAVPADTAIFHSRTAGSLDGARGAESPLDRAAAANVLLLTGARLGERLTDDLAASGVGTIRGGRTDPDAGNGEPDRDDDLVVVLDEPGAPVPLDVVLRRARANGVPVLRIARVSGAVETGPLFWPGETACAGCLRRGRDDQPRTAGGTSVDEAGDDLLAARAAMEALAVLARGTAATTLNTVLRTSLTDFATERLLLVPDADCPECGDPKYGPSDEAALLIDAYERHQALPPGRPAPPPRILAPRRRQLQRLMNRRSTIPTSPSRALPPEEPGERPPGPIHLDAVAALLSRTAGTHAHQTHGAVTRDTRRAVAGDVALGSVELYVLADEDLFELPGTVFAYDDIAHRVRSVHAEPVPWRTAAPPPPPYRAGAALVIAACISRTAAVYGDGAWRLAHLDAGFAATRLATAAPHLGIRADFAFGQGGDLAEWLELDPARQAVTALAWLVPPSGEGGST